MNRITKEITIPSNYKYILANDGQGLVFYDQLISSPDEILNQFLNKNVYRVANPQEGLYPYPNGKFRYYNYSGQPLDVNGNNGNPLGETSTHFNLLSY